jgi:diguanylate cyclase (GGDEF)-like protein
VICDPAEPVADVRALRARVRELERDRGEALERTRLLVALQRDIVRIATAKTPAHIVMRLLRGAYDSLGYSRAIYFNVDRDHGIAAWAQIDSSDRIDLSDAVASTEIGGPFFDAVRGFGSYRAGRPEGSPPLLDARGAYALSPLRDGARTLGILYVDDPRPAHPFRAEPALLDALTAVAAASIGSSVLLERATELATLDPLTGLLNRRVTAERFSAELASCRRRTRSLAYAMIDVDDLKGLNDSRGHAHGDATLVGVAQALARSSRAGDIVSRSGGDEFAVIMPGADGVLARTLIARFGNEFAAAGLRCSIGVAVFPEDGRDEASLMLSADRALYAAKAAGKNGSSFARAPGSGASVAK